MKTDVLPAADRPATTFSVRLVSKDGKFTLHVDDSVGAICTQDHKNDSFALVAEVPVRGGNSSMIRRIVESKMHS